MRTNIVIDDELLRRATELTGLSTKKAVVQEALEDLVRTKQQERVLGLRVKIHWSGDLDALRQERRFAGAAGAAGEVGDDST